MQMFFLRLLANWKCPTEPNVRQFWIWKFLSLNYSNFAIECDWNEKISQIRAKLGFFFKKSDRFIKKKAKFSKIGERGKFAVEFVVKQSNEIIS